MKLFKRKKKEYTGMPDMNTVSLSTVFNSFSIHPLPFEHSEKFLIDGIDPLAVERERIKGRSVDWLLHDMRDSSIEADSKEEIAYGKRQFTNKTYSVGVIVAENEGELKLANEQEKLILEELNYYDKLEAELSR